MRRFEKDPRSEEEKKADKEILEKFERGEILQPMHCPVCRGLLHYPEIEEAPDVITCNDCDFHAEGFVKGHWGDFLIDTNDTEVSHVDAAGQRLAFRVGPVFVEDDVGGEALWIWYQEKHMESSKQGDVLMSKEAWDKLVEIVNSRWRKGDKDAGQKTEV
jgi:hypothetical protein